MLTDTSIRTLLTTDRTLWTQNEEIRNKKLLIDNFKEKSLTPVGYDLRVGENYIIMLRKIKESAKLKNDEKLSLAPGEIVAIETEEYVGMPQSRNLSGILVSKVSLVEKGFSHISTSIDADWKGSLVITMTNQTKRTVTLERGQPFCTMIFFKNEDAATIPCERHPSEHWRLLMEDWKLIKKTPRKTLYLWTLKFVISAAPWISLKFIQTIDASHVAMLVASSSLLFNVADKIFKTD